LTVIQSEAAYVNWYVNWGQRAIVSNIREYCYLTPFCYSLALRVPEFFSVANEPALMRRPNAQD